MRARKIDASSNLRQLVGVGGRVDACDLVAAGREVEHDGAEDAVAGEHQRTRVVGHPAVADVYPVGWDAIKLLRRSVPPSNRTMRLVKRRPVHVAFCRKKRSRLIYRLGKCMVTARGTALVNPRRSAADCAVAIPPLQWAPGSSARSARPISMAPRCPISASTKRVVGSDSRTKGQVADS